MNLLRGSTRIVPNSGFGNKGANLKNQNEWDDAEGRRIEMVNSCIVNKARQMFILTFLHTKGDALTIEPTK